MIKKSVDIITSYYNDSHRLNWKSLCNENLPSDVDITFTVYRKDDSLELDLNICRLLDNGEYLIPNIGRCDFSFLLHIVRNYDSLSDVNIFTKVNWSDQRNDFPLLLSDSTVYDFCDVGDTPELQIWDYAILDSDVDQYLDKLGISKQHIQTIDVRKNKKNGHYHHAFKSDCIHDWYIEIFRDVKPPEVFWSWCHGPCFSVTKELIRRHPKKIYEYLLSRFLPESNSWDKDLGKKLMTEVKGYVVSDKEVMDDAAHHYHDSLLRFWRVLFVHNLEKNDFNIKIN
jgi:hypothetical protein